MQTFLWLVIFLGGAALMLAVTALLRLLLFLFGRSQRLDRDAAPHRRRRGVLLGLPSRIAFFFWSFLLLVSGLVLIGVTRLGDRSACRLLEDGSGVSCTGFPGAEPVAWIVSLPAALAQYTQQLIAVARAPQSYLQEGIATLPPSELALGLIGPVLLLLAWIGLGRMLGDVGRLWRGR